MRRRPSILLLVAAAAFAPLGACGNGDAGSFPAAGDGADGGPTANAGTFGGGAGGSTGDGAGASASGAPHLPCDVDAVLAKSCRGCHGATTQFGAPDSLVTYADLVAPLPNDPSTKTYDAVKARVHDAARPMPPSPSPRLSDADLKTIDDWVAAGAPSSTEACGGSGNAGGAGPTDPEPLACDPDTHIRPPAPYAVDASTVDQYVCYGFDVTPAQKRHVIALAPKIDNKAVVHHLLLFQADQAYSTTPQPCAAFGSASWRLVSGWAPGGKNLILPSEAGFPEEGTTHWILQVHYNNAKALTNQKDASGYDLCTTDELRANDADVMAFGSVRFSIPPHASLNWGCDYTWSGPKVHAFGASPHMHLRGRAMSTVNRTAKATVIDQPHFDFQTQLAYPTSVDLTPGDALHTVCGWSNDTDQTIGFGEKTGDEMCFDFVSYYPKITSPLWSWTTPSVLASCAAQ